MCNILFSQVSNANKFVYSVADVGGAPQEPDGILQAHGATSLKDSLLNLQLNPKVWTLGLKPGEPLYS